MNNFSKGTEVLINGDMSRTREYCGWDNPMDKMVRDGKIYKVIDISCKSKNKVQLDNHYWYRTEDLQMVKKDGPYKSINLKPEIFDINNLVLGKK